jgi:hypothetical protein
LAGESREENNDINVNTAVFFLPVMMLFSVLKTGLSGLEDGLWNDRLLKHSAVTVAYQ